MFVLIIKRVLYPEIYFFLVSNFKYVQPNTHLKGKTFLKNEKLLKGGAQLHWTSQN